jgi:hypothetical protein
MPHLFYELKALPPNVYDAGAIAPFRAAMSAWRKLGLGPIVDRVDGNGVLHRLDNGADRLCVWPPDGEYSPPTGNETRIVIDDELTVTWFGATAPGPLDLDNGNPLRLQTIPLVLADGEVWEIPEIREPSGSRLPTDLTRDRKTGQLRNPIKREYEQLWQECEYWFDLRFRALTGDATSFSLDRALIFATQILGLRHRFCDATQSALRVIDSVNVMPLIEIAIGWPAVLERVREITADTEDDSQKKSRAPSAESVNGSSGPEASDHSTDRHEVSNG